MTSKWHVPLATLSRCKHFGQFRQRVLLRNRLERVCGSPSDAELQNFLKGSRHLDSLLSKCNETRFETLSLENLHGCALPVCKWTRKDP